jgi:hypothetical protein
MVALVWLALGPLAMLYGSCAIMCDGCDMTCPAAPGVEHAPRVDSVVALDEVPPTGGERRMSVALTPPAPPPKSLLSV